jgi:microcystin-dependent protein
MSEPFLGEIRIVGFNFPPKGWALCNGTLMQISQNQALFSILGTTYGGNGQTTFALPNLQGRVPLHVGAGLILGQVGGEEVHTLNIIEAGHSHSAMANASSANQAAPGGNVWGNAQQSNYAAAANTTMAPGTVSTVGGSQGHENRSPYLVLIFVIALQGIFPSRN